MTDKRNICSLTRDQFLLIDDQLSNNDSASDDELLEFWQENGIDEEYCSQAISLRPEFLINPLAKLDIVDGELAAGNHKLRSSPKAR